jgi:oxalate decarboxylase/phosphoglucose isomerase-like protein (cupin superfamily)
MALNIRRVITGLNADGKSTVTIDDIASNKRSGRPGHESLIVWTTDTTPAPATETRDAGNWTVSTPPIPNGSIFRITEYGPGVTSRMHSNETVDYTVIMSGEIVMLLEDGCEVHLRAGDVVVQRATKHDWVNRGTVPCVVAFILLDARKEG